MMNVIKNIDTVLCNTELPSTCYSLGLISLFSNKQVRIQILHTAWSTCIFARCCYWTNKLVWVTYVIRLKWMMIWCSINFYLLCLGECLSFVSGYKAVMYPGQVECLSPICNALSNFELLCKIVQNSRLLLNIELWLVQSANAG